MASKKRSSLIFLLSLGIFGALSFTLPVVKIEQGLVEIVLSITSILFGILAGFFISQMWDKFSNVRKYSAEYEANLLSWIRAVELLEGNEEVKEKFKERTDQYLVAWLTLPWYFADEDRKYFKRVHSLMKNIDISSEKNKALYESILSHISDTIDARKKVDCLR